MSIMSLASRAGARDACGAWSLDRHNAKDFSGSHIKSVEVFVGCLSGYGYLNVKKLPTLP